MSAARKLETVVPMDDDKRAIFDKLGPDLDAVRMPLNRIMIAIYKAPEVTKGGIIRPAIVTDEDEHQGVAGLVVKMGPHCYEENDAIAWQEDDKCKVGDWVMFRRGDGFKVRVGPVLCIVMESERGIKMVLPKPDLVY